MSFPQDADDMERPTTAGSIKRARERAAAGIPREDFATFAKRMAGDDEPQERRQPPTAPPVNPSATSRRAVGEPSAGPSRIPRPQAPPGLQKKDGQIQVAISRPTPVAQWPLAGPLTSPPQSAEAEPYRPPAGKSQPPQRPPRPSRVPSMLDGSKVQDHTPVFQYTPQTGRESELSIPATPASSASRPSTQSSVGSIPDFPLPVSIPVAPPRRSVNLGPPPSARRGASSFYSNASYVSPIPEESPRSRSHASFASSAAMPESWGTPSPGPSPNYPDASYEDAIIEEGRESVYDDDVEGDESRLVRSASIGKRGKASLVTTTIPVKAPETAETVPRPGPVPVQSGGAGRDAFRDGTGYIEASSSSSGTIPTKATLGATLTADSILNAFDAASSTDPSNPSRRTSVSPQPPGSRPYSRLSAIRRPPKLDLDAVKKAEARGSMTILPDLIRRATRLAASLERGRRPASRFDDLDFSPNAGLDGRDGDKELSGMFSFLLLCPTTQIADADIWTAIS